MGKGKQPSAAEAARLHYMTMRARGKQFNVQPMKQGILPNAYFDGQMPRMFAGEQYDIKLPRGRPVMGFCSSNAVERGEYGIVRRCEGAREVMLKEFVRERNERKKKNMPRELPPLEGAPQFPSVAEQNSKVALFDLVYDKVNPVKAIIPDYDSQIFKLERDTKNPARLINNRHMGWFRTTTNRDFACRPSKVTELQMALPKTMLAR
mmetsp:Transcript_31064/g.67853  ORF Transcript_31064/g.67853 Transcript_31064/m.67853 type:complete len:207 (+) Transcript_31064:239-859(+)|eukprot:CAMPEP_0118927492 /NCGR_PEP_ID=MMETSP1169-20130426/4939_1 /TAXON_ID=36882 /ORGANISM="Pyramimonas obovata, Strain CCMP722" /LENGTH=206 /DNA_ID=CAMNT_0006869253 /DNA_START=238 /DNA_END=858 /DNA_ORIENTATION=+